MKVFTEMTKGSHEQVVFGFDPDTGLKAIIAIHNTALGPALGGTRMWPYKSEDEALNDALRLSHGMTYKAAAAGLNLGGGKGVIIGNPDKDKNEILFRSYGRLVQGLHGRYITAEDVGIGVRDVEWMRSETSYVVGISESLGGSGDPSPFTAKGVYYGMKACVEEVFGTSSLSGLTVAIQGLGHVGMHLAELLFEDKVNLFVTDLHEDRVKNAVEKFGATAVEGDEIYSVKADIFAPCALGAIINDKTIKNFHFKIIAGAANNQLDDEIKHGEILRNKNILYAPDYVINAGGLINVAHEIESYNRDRALKHVEGMYHILKDLIKVSKDEKIPTNIASNRIAERRIDQVARLRRKFVSTPPVCFKHGRIYK